jgi:hypothetical protein
VSLIHIPWYTFAVRKILKKIIGFLDELGVFIEEKLIFTKKKNSVALPLPRFHGCPNEPAFLKMLLS